jgi:hypothetical protein
VPVGDADQHARKQRPIGTTMITFDLVPFGNWVTGIEVRFRPLWDRRLAACCRS